MMVLGLMGWSGSGKTTLICKLVPDLVGRGLEVSTVKHTHHDVDVDKPGKDSFLHRHAGAREVMLAAPSRWSLVREFREETPSDLKTLIARMAPVDLILVEGFRQDPYPKIEVFRPAMGRPRLGDGASHVVAVASDGPVPDLAVPLLDLNDVQAIADFIVDYGKLGRR
ncbi:MAG: molybdopterin-guanine dinucleotide biosynthesis protein B [Alphaproteobacteria bacterium]|nr:molybdopterin-guanine dinucleotide biosynthesis protein B [Alphaproteobacteria bacterium]